MIKPQENELKTPADRLHGRTIQYNQISQMPDRNGYLCPASFAKINNDIRKSSDLMFMPSALHEMHMQDKKYEKSKYKIVLWGILQDGRRATVVLNGIQPYFEVLVPDLPKGDQNGDFAEELFEKLKDQSKMEPVKYEINTGRQFKLFKKEKNYYVRFYFNKSTFRKNAIKFVRSEGLQTVHDDLTCYYRVVCRDKFLSFTNWNVLSDYKVGTNKSLKGSIFNIDLPSGGYKKFEGDISDDVDLVKDKSMTMTWDIETFSPDGRLPVPENPTHRLFMIGISCHWYHSPANLLKVCLVDKPCKPHKDYLTIVCGSEDRVIKAFGKIFEKMKPEFLVGFNDADYDWPWLITRASQKPGLLTHLAKCMDFTKPWRPYCDTDILKYNYSSSKVKVEADMYAEGNSLQFPGYINLDVRTIFRQLYPTAEKSSLNWFLQKNKMAGKKDMPYQEMFKIYRRMLRVTEKNHEDDVESDDEDDNEFAVETRKCKTVEDFSERMREVAEYCVIDAERCHELMKIRYVIMDRREVSSVAYTSLFEAFYRANGSKVRNLVIARGQKIGLKISNITDENQELPEGKYPGGFVFAPKKGLVTSKLTMRERRKKAREFEQKNKTVNRDLREWLNISDEEIDMYEEFISEHTAHVDFDSENDPNMKILCEIVKKHIPECVKKFFTEVTGRPITGLDFSSLYPSLIMTYNLSPEYMVTNQREARKLDAERNPDGTKKYNLHKIKFKMGNRTYRAWSISHDNKLDENSDDYRFGIYPKILKELFDTRKLMKKDLHHWEGLKEEMEGLSVNEFNTPENRVKYDNIEFQFNLINSKQKALKVFMNTFYGETGNKRSPFFLLELAGGITTKGQRNTKAANKLVSDLGCNTWYGDSVTGDTPVLIREGNSVKFVEIQDLVKEYKSQDNGKEVANVPYEVWSDSGWTKIKKVIRHKTEKKIFRVLTHTGVVDCTEDHSLLNPQKECVKPGEIKVGEELLHHELPSISQEMDKVTPAEAFVWGMFVGDGSCGRYQTKHGVKDSWALNNQDKKLLIKCQDYLKDMGVKSKILETMESSGVYKLVPAGNKYGTISKLVAHFRHHCYDKKSKIVPIQILQSSEAVRLEFFKGYYCADGDKSSNNNFYDKKFELLLKRFDVKNKITAMSFFMLVKSLGYKCSINTRKDKLDIYRLTITKRAFKRSPIKIKKIEDLGSNEGYVYDLETETHHFSAGVGELVVHNTDSIYLAMPHDRFQELDRRYYSGKMTKLEYWEELVNITFKEIQPIRDIVNNWFFKDNGTRFLRMAYEEALFPVTFLAKKKYYGIPHISVPNFNFKYLFIRGLEVKKRGVSQFLRDICNSIMETSVSPDNLYSLLELIQNQIHHIYASEYDFKDFIMTDVYKPNKQNVKVQTFARRMKDRGIKVKPWERFNYVIVQKNPFFYDHRGRKRKLLVGDKMEYPANAQASNMKIDMDYYMQGSINGQLARLITYHPLFHVEPEDDTQDEEDIAEKKIYSKAGKYVDNFCKSYYTNYTSKGKLYQKVFKIANKVVNKKLKEVYDHSGIVDLIGSSCDLGKLETWLCEKSEKVAIKVAKGYGQLYVEDQLQRVVDDVVNTVEYDSDEEEESINTKALKRKKLQDLQSVYFSNKSNLSKTREMQFRQRSDILKRNIRENIEGIKSLYNLNQNMIETLSQKIKEVIKIDENFNDAGSSVPVWNDIKEIEDIDELELDELMNSKIEELMNNQPFWKAINKLRFIYTNLVSNYEFIHKTRSIVDHLKTCRNKVSNTYLGKGFDKKSFLKESVDDLIGKEKF